MRPDRLIAFSLIFCLVAGLAASGVYAMPECGMGMSAVPMKMENCGGGQGCCGCEMEATLPHLDFGKITSGPASATHQASFEETLTSADFFHAPSVLLPRDRAQEDEFPPGNLYDLYSDYRI